MEIKVNGETLEIDVEGEMPLLWVLRDELGITGPKYGCGVAFCGACTVLIEGSPVRSCSLPVSAVWAEVTTIEGLSEGEDYHPIQAAWIEKQVPQCGYCQSGQILQTHAFLKTNPNPSDEDIDNALSGNLCRCGTYPRIKEAVKLAAEKMGQEA